eukprot:110214_1
MTNNPCHNEEIYGCKTETFQFHADIAQLMSLLNNAKYSKLYNNRERFLRELISNSCDALHKIRSESLKDLNVLTTGRDLKIEIIPHPQSRTLTIRDTGIGMTKCDLITNLGTIANSKAHNIRPLIQPTITATHISMLPLFGIGFYSAYLVSDRVIVRSKHNDDQQYIWGSSSDHTFSVRPDSKSAHQLQRGTEIICLLKEEFTQYLEEKKIKQIVKSFDHILSFPVHLFTSEGEWELLNKPRPIWTLNPDEVTKEQYTTFYKSISNDCEDYFAVKHFIVQGQLEFAALLFVPKRAPFDIDNRNNLKLFVRRVFVMDNCTQLLPDWLNFIYGVVDSEDLPSNVSLETLSEKKILKLIQKYIVRKLVEMLSELARNMKEDYKIFYEEFHKYLKLGVYENKKNRKKISELLRYSSTKTGDKEMISFKEYVERMQDDQKIIYYILGESKGALELSPYLDVLRKRDLEVLFLVDAIDKYVMEKLIKYDGKKLLDAKIMQLPEFLIFGFVRNRIQPLVLSIIPYELLYVIILYYDVSIGF